MAPPWRFQSTAVWHITMPAEGPSTASGADIPNIQLNVGLLLSYVGAVSIVDGRLSWWLNQLAKLGRSDRQVVRDPALGQRLPQLLYTSSVGLASVSCHKCEWLGRATISQMHSHRSRFSSLGNEPSIRLEVVEKPRTWALSLKGYIRVPTI